MVARLSTNTIYEGPSTPGTIDAGKILHLTIGNDTFQEENRIRKLGL